jgi:hypothetical protein
MDHNMEFVHVQLWLDAVRSAYYKGCKKDCFCTAQLEDGTWRLSLVDTKEQLLRIKDGTPLCVEGATDREAYAKLDALCMNGLEQLVD